MYIIEIIGMAGTTPEPPHERPWYLTDFDPDANDGWGDLGTSPDIEEAMLFATSVGAWEFWRRESTVRPYRPDGQPNRPLTAFTVQVKEAPPTGRQEES